MKKSLGLEITPTGIGWSVIEESGGVSRLVKCGVRTFKDAVDHTPQGEKSSASVRTGFRSVRKQLGRNRYRRVLLLSLLSEKGLCPEVSKEELDLWKKKKIFPKNDALVSWLGVNAAEGKDPYTDRHECLHRSLDLSLQSDRYMLGRALYHLSFHRGYVDDKNDPDVETRGKVLGAIKALSDDMKAAGCKWLGDYFYSVKDKEVIRRRYLSRTQHVEPEFDAICDRQELDAGLRKELHDIIFYQRPLKSQKYSVGRCVYVPSKFRCKTSHPLFEEFRLLETLGNIKIAGPGEDKLRPLNDGEKECIMHLFFRKSKPSFDFVEVAADLSGEKYGKNYSGKALGAWRFNYRLDQSVAGCPVTAAIIAALGRGADYRNWKDVLDSRYVRHNGNALGDLWHTLEFFTDSSLDRQTVWLKDNFGMEEDEARKLAGFPMPKPYAAMSLNAISRILVFMREGRTVYESVFLAGLADCVPDDVKEDAVRMSRITEEVSVIIDDFRHLPASMKENRTVEGQVRDYLIGNGYNPDAMWLPGAMVTLAPVRDEKTGALKLGSPISNSLRNPLVMRCLVQAGQVINSLLDEGVIDPTTVVRFSCNSEINTINMRGAIYKMNSDARKERDAAMKAIEENGAAVTEDSILRYLLWKEQKELDLLSGKQLSLTDALSGSVTTVDRIVPVNLGGGDGRVNRILTANMNATKHDGRRIADCFDMDLVRETLRAADWYRNLETLEKNINGKKKAAKGAPTKDAKDTIIKDRHIMEIKADYLTSKMNRILYTDFVDDADSLLKGRYGSIGKYLEKYLMSVFPKVSAYGNEGVARIARMWGLGKDGGNYAELLSAATVTACIGKKEYDAFCRFQKNAETNHAYGRALETFEKPWPSFTEDVRKEAENLITSRREEGRLVKESRRKLRDSKGRIIRDADGKPLVSKGNTVRGSLHRATFYGKIMLDGQLLTVGRKKVESLTEPDIENIVDPGTRAAFMKAIEEYGSIKEAVKNGIYVNSGTFPVRHVRIKTFLKDTFVIKEHQQKSRFDYKNGYHVANETNDFMLVRNETSEDSKAKTFEVFSNLESVKTAKSLELGDNDRIIRKGTGVIFFEKDIRELKNLSRKELSDRFYHVTGLGKQMCFRHHLDIGTKAKSAIWSPNGGVNPAFIQYYNKWPFAVEGKDFIVSKTGDIKFLF